MTVKELYEICKSNNLENLQISSISYDDCQSGECKLSVIKKDDKIYFIGETGYGGLCDVLTEDYYSKVKENRDVKVILNGVCRKDKCRCYSECKKLNIIDDTNAVIIG